MNGKIFISRFLRSNLHVLLLCIIVNLLSRYSRTSGAAYLGYMADAIGTHRIYMIPKLGATGAVIMVTFYVLRWLSTIIGNYMSQKLAFDVRKSLLSHLSKISFLTYEQKGAGDLQSAIANDALEASHIINIVCSTILNQLTLFIFSAAYMATINIETTLVTVTLAIVMALVNAGLLKKVKSEKYESRRSAGKLTEVLRSAFTAADTIKTYDAADYAAHCLEKQRDIYNKKMLNCTLLDAIRITIYSLADNLTLYGSMIYLGYIGIKGDISVADAVVLIYLIKQMLMPISVVFRQMFNLASNGAAWERIENIFKITADDTKKEQPLCDSFNISGLTFSYDDQNIMFDNMEEIHLKYGNTYWFQGSSGSGKTTLLKLLMGLYKNDTIKINGNINAGLDGMCAYCSAKFELFPLSIYENIALGDETITKEQCCNIIEKMGFGKWLSSLPMQIDTPVVNGGANLSGGQKQAIANARALLSTKKIVILDEPFSALDTAHEEALCKVLTEEKKNKIIIITSHRVLNSSFYDEKISIV